MFQLAAPVARDDEGGADARVARKLGIAVAVADHPAARQVEVEFARGAKEQPRPRLAAVAILPVRRLAHGRVVRAVVNRVEPRAAALKFVRQEFVDFADYLLL